MTKFLPTTSFGFPTADLKFVNDKLLILLILPIDHVVPAGLEFLLAALSLLILKI